MEEDLGKYFADKSIRLVLGIDAPLSFSSLEAIGTAEYEQSGVPLVGANGHNHSGSLPFARLAKLSLIHRIGSLAGGRVPGADSFEVGPSVGVVAAIDPRIITEQRFKAISSSNDVDLSVSSTSRLRVGAVLLLNRRYDDFAKSSSLGLLNSKTELWVSRSDVGNTRIGLGGGPGEQRDYPLKIGDFVLTDTPGVYVATAQTGLYNFAQTLSDHRRAFAYAVSPQEQGVLLRSGQSGTERLGAGFNAGALNGKAGVATENTASVDELRNRASIIGFGENVAMQDGPENANGEATFGWIINPQNLDALPESIVFRQALKKYAVSALVSVPSWWRSIVISTTTAWRLQSGSDVQRVTHRETIEIPSDFEAFEETLLGSQGPDLDASALDNIRLTAGEQDQAIVIPGRRLWRSTQVTLGNEISSNIAVLPNMKGIVATFHVMRDMSTPDEVKAWCDENPQVDDVEITRTVRVWTSQGAVTLPRPATIYILGKCVKALKHSRAQ